MNTPDVPIELPAVRLELRRSIRECSQRGLIQSAKWLAEMDYALREHKIPGEAEVSEPAEPVPDDEREAYTLAKTYFDCQEYQRAAHFLESCASPRCVFLLRYAQYMSGEKKRLDNAVEAGSDSGDTQVLLDLLSYFKKNRNALDGYLLYLYGVVLKKLDLRSQATEVLVASVRSVPTLWAAWLELAQLVASAGALEALRPPTHWMLHFFTGHVLVQLKLTEQALDVYSLLAAAGFDKSSYVTAQLAIAHHDRRDVDTALSLFRQLQQSDPYRLDEWDYYSHLLYLKERRMELAHLAQRASDIDKYRVQTCCVIGNYYSLRSERQKAVVYFQRALSLDPQYLSAWILMGHEFMELQNSNAAIQCYRQAIDVNGNDYRAWNGLGQAYEILGLNGYCVYYYARAAQLKPDDSRMLVSLGEAYEKMDKIPNALKCYYRAHSTGDIEGMALFKLAKLYERLLMWNSAGAAYTAASQDQANSGSKELPGAYRYLANYHLRLSLLDHAAHYAYKCLDHESTKEEGKALLKSISEKRAAGAAPQTSKGTEEMVDSAFAHPDLPKTPAPSPSVAPEGFSTPVWPATRKGSSRYKM